MLLHSANWLKRSLWILALLAIVACPLLPAPQGALEPTGQNVASPANSALYPAGDAAFPVAYSPLVAQMIASVQPGQVSNYVGGLSGEFSIMVGGQPITLFTRNTHAETYLAQATQYAYEFMQTQGLATSYHPWSNSWEDLSGRNVVGALTGAARPGEIVLITAHLDDMPESGRAPGADDDAGGSVGVLMAAKNLAGHAFERSVRFVLFTGEEDGLLGSQAYAHDCRAKNENIVAVFNMDMIGWDGNNDGKIFLHTRRPSDPAGYQSDLAIANVFTWVVSAYGLSSPKPHILADGESNVDSASFWDEGYPALLAIEDYSVDEDNPHWHQASDTLSTLNLSYLTGNVKAAVGTAAHLAIPVEALNKLYLPLALR